MKFLYSSFFVFLFLTVNLFSQIKCLNIINNVNGIELDLQISKESFNIVKENDVDKIEYTKYIDESLPGSPILPSKTIFIAIPPYSKVSTGITVNKENTIKNVSIKLNPGTEFKEEKIIYKDVQPNPEYFSNDFYPQTKTEITGYSWIREYYCAVIRINTHNYNWKKKEITEILEAELRVSFYDTKPFIVNSSPKGKFDEVLSKIILNYDFADGFRSIPSYSLTDSTGAWIDYSKEYIKLGISEDGIYKISFDDLISYGVNPSQIDPQSFRIFSKGKEIPLFVYGENDLTFDSGDYIEFYCEKNYGSPDYKNIAAIGQDYLNYSDRYNDTNFVWLTWEGPEGLRADSVNTFNPLITDTVKNHLVRLHLEKDERLWYYDATAPRVQLPMWQENKVWTWHFLGNNGSLAIGFNSPDFLPNSVVQTTVRLISNAADITSNAHSSAVSLNSGPLQDTIFYDYKQTVNLSSQFSSDILLQNGNTLNVQNLQTQAGFHQFLIDWIDVEYFRSNVAVEDSITILIPDSISTAERMVVVSNIIDLNNLFLYKIKPQLKRITAFDFSNNNLAFTDTVSGGDKYLILKNIHKKIPEFVARKRFINLRDPSRTADYIIISNIELEESVTHYKTFIEDSYQLNAEAVFIDDIYDEFSFGLEKPEAIRDFLHTAYNSWQSPKPSFLTIIGDANYDYKNIILPPTNIIRKNLVPSYGNPVSDVWFVTWDSLNINIPQMFVGRIPAVNNSDVEFYLSKHDQYIKRQYDEWNKNYLFFSGGDSDSPGQLEQIKNANDNLLNNIVIPKPVGGSGIHFYKTINPVTNFGPYSLEKVREAIDEGGLFVSYIGHSGTQTWDNGITSVEDLKNKYPDRHSLISDFGCSTGKFAEPDIDAFGELFLLSDPDGQAINYLGNTSWGYLSTSLRYPGLFYSNLLIDSLSSIGEAHLTAKIEQFSESGFTDVNRVFNYCNLLFGDPVISFKTPLKPNFIVKDNSFSIASGSPNDMTDSVVIRVEIQNAGRVSDDSLQINARCTLSDEIIYENDFKIVSPLFRDTLFFKVPVQGKVGGYLFQLTLDSQNTIDEHYENDNSASFIFTVFSTSIRPVEVEKFYHSEGDSIRVLNPTVASSSESDLTLSVADNPDFENAVEIHKNQDSVYTTFPLESITTDKRYWWRARLNSSSQEWSETYSFKNHFLDYKWFIDKSFNGNDLIYNSSAFDSTGNKWLLAEKRYQLEISSAGHLDGSFASMLYNGQEYLPNTYFWGIGTAEIDTINYKPENFRFFLYENPNAADEMTAYLDSLPAGKLVAMTISTDGAQSVLGFSGGTPVRRAIENFGSLYIDSVRYRDSWCIIGEKGAPQGSVPESFKKQYFGFAEISVTKTVNTDSGYVVFPPAGKSSEWISIEKEDSLPAGASIKYIPLGVKSNGDVDTLPPLIFSGNSSPLGSINAALYPKLKILAKLYANDIIESPAINSLGINYKLPPELAINYQVVNLEKDTLLTGDAAKLNFAVFNASETPADSFKILVEIIKSNNQREIISDIPAGSIDSLGKKYFEILLNTADYTGNNNFTITVDHQNRISEIFEDNNFFQVPFYVQPDTSVPSLNITFDGENILDGEYVSADPEIKIELSDGSFLPVTDPSSVLILLNNEEINPDTSIVSYQYNSSNPKAVVTFKPHLVSGEYTLKVIGTNSAGARDSAVVYFIINEETELLNVFNYPNPSNGETHFTFRLTQIPDILKIRIYTVAGRLIKEIKLNSSQLGYDFNTIFWDGRDDDQNEIANGVYLYKVIITKDGKSRDVTQKLAIVR